MLAEQILSTLRFFDLQNLPLTALEIHKFLVAERTSAPTSLDQIIIALKKLADENRISQSLGFYCLPNRQPLVKERLRNYLHGLPRERLISRYAKTFRHLPFIRAVALAGSQALGEYKSGSDIDLLIITDQRFLWTARVFITGYLQLLGVRRYGRRIANRFCLNHYVAGPKLLIDSRNLYTAMEYLKLRPLVAAHMVREFQEKNISWIKELFPNADQHLIDPVFEDQSVVQRTLEFIFNNAAGRFFEKKLGELQLKRIRISKDILVRGDELSFHPDSKQAGLLAKFYGVDRGSPVA